jgi:hypothetical protein
MSSDDRPTRRHLLRGLLTGLAGAAAGVAATGESASAASTALLSETENVTSATTGIRLANPGPSFGYPTTVLTLTDADVAPSPSLEGLVTIDATKTITGLRVRAPSSGLIATSNGWGAVLGGKQLGAIVASTAENTPCLGLAPQEPCLSPHDHVDPSNGLSVLYVERNDPDQGILSNVTLWWGSQCAGDTWRRLAGPDTAGALSVLPAPVRLYDSRPGFAPDAGEKGPLEPGTSRSIDAKGNDSGVPAHAKALAINLTVTGGSADGYLVAYPDGQPTPEASSINWSAGQTVANGLIVGLGPNETLALATVEPVHVVIDISGYYL